MSRVRTRMVRWWLGGVAAVGLLTSLTGPSAAAADAGDPYRPAAIRTEQVPRLPAELVEQLAMYQNTRAAGFAGWAPSGRGMLARTRFGNSLQLHRVYEPGGRREQVTFFDEPVRGGFVRGATDDAILVSASRGGDENFQIYLLDEGLYPPRLLTDGASRNSVGPITDDGARLIISSNRRNGRDTDLYLVDPRRPDDAELIWETDGEFWYASDWCLDGRYLVLGRFVSVNESYLAVLDTQTGERVDLEPPAPGQISSVSSAQFAPDGRSIYLTSDARGEFHELARYDLESHAYEWLTEDIAWDVSDVVVDRQSGRVALVVNEDGASRMFLVEDGKRRELPLPLGIVSGLEFSPDGRQLGFTLSQPAAPSDAYSLTIDDGQLTRWTYSELGGLDAERFVTPERIRFESFDELVVPAYYFRPEGARPDVPAPVLIHIHGGPESQYRPFFSSITQYYVNELGLAVIYPNVRGSSGYGKTYLQLDNGMLREDAVRDIGALLDWIDEQPELDSSRIAVAGGSYGGYMVLATAFHYGERIRCGINVVGIANFITFLENTADYRRDLRRVEYGDERDPEMRAFFERINPTSNAHLIRCALLVIHGVNDPRVPYSEAVQIAERVRAEGRPVWTVYADNEGHGFARKENSDYQRAVEVLFLQEHLELE